MAKKRDLSNEDKKTIAYDLYMNTQLSQKEICERVIITEATFTSWKKKYDWEVHKQAFSITSQNIISNLMEKAYNMTLEDTVNSDAILKLVKSIESLSDKKTTISQIINVFKGFTQFAFDKNPEIAKEINLLQRQYVDEKINQH